MSTMCTGFGRRIIAALVAFFGVVTTGHASEQLVSLNYAGSIDTITYATCVEYSGGNCASYSFSARTSQAIPEVGTVSLGQSYSGNYIYDAAAPLSTVVDGDQGIYFSAIVGAFVSISTVTFSKDQSACCLSIVNRSNGTDTFLPMFSKDLGDWFALSYLGLSDLAGQIFSSFELPTELTIQDFGYRALFLNFLDRTSGDQILLMGSVDSLSFSPAIPEPSTYALMALGLGAVCFRARRSKAAQSAA